MSIFRGIEGEISRIYQLFSAMSLSSVATFFFLITCSTSSLVEMDSKSQSFSVLSSPAPGSPFHHAFPVHSLPLAKAFYSGVLGCEEGRSSDRWQDYSLHGHQIGE